MSAVYDAYKEEVFRLTCTAEGVKKAIERHVRSLHTSFLPGARIEMINENHYQTREKLVMTVAGSIHILEDMDFKMRNCCTREMEKDRHRRQLRWIVRQMKDYGQTLGAHPNQVSTCNGTVYFSYHVVVKQESHLPE
jgi:hypothetical protein